MPIKALFGLSSHSYSSFAVLVLAFFSFHSGPADCSLRFLRSLSHCRRTQVFTNRKLHSVDFGDEAAGRQTIVDEICFCLAKQGKLLLKVSNSLQRRSQLCITCDHYLVSTISTIPRRLPSRFVCQKSIVACSHTYLPSHDQAASLSQGRIPMRQSHHQIP